MVYDMTLTKSYLVQFLFKRRKERRIEINICKNKSKKMTLMVTLMTFFVVLHFWPSISTFV
jgi:hypothetical protein